MGRRSRMKKERRQQASYAASLTASEGSWLEHMPSAEEQSQILSSSQMLRAFRLQAQELGSNPEEFNRLSLEMYRDPRWNVLHFEDWLIESILEEVGEPPIVSDNDDPAFSNYLLRALGVIATARVRRVLAEQSRRFLPQYVGEGKIREGLMIEHNAYMSVMSEAATPLLVEALDPVSTTAQRRNERTHAGENVRRWVEGSTTLRAQAAGRTFTSFSSRLPRRCCCTSKS